jgi:type IV secretion system protein VirD4
VNIRDVEGSPLLIGRRGSAARLRKPIGFLPQQEAFISENGGDDWVTYGGTSHCLTIGTTGSGKTAQAIGNMLTYRGSAIVFDSKGDIYEATARRRREMGQEVHAIDLRDSKRCGDGTLNPFDLALRCGTEQAVIARSLACQLVARTGSERENFWADYAETCITGAIGYALAQRKRSLRNLGTVYDLLHDGDSTYRIAMILEDKAMKLSRACRSAFAGLLELPGESTRPSVVGTAQAALRLWDSDLVRKLTATTSFDLDALINASDSRPMSLYIIVPSYREAYRPLLRLWFDGLLSALMQREQLPEYRTLILSDETASFGRIPSFLTAATQARSFGIQLWTHFQNAAQLQIYGADGAHTLVDNAGVLQLLGAPNRRVALEFAALVGGIDADEILSMGPLEQVVFMDGRLHRLRRIRYFEEARFAGHYDPVKKPVAPRVNPGGAHDHP